MTTLGWVDYAVMALYFAFVLGIGAALRRYVRTSEDFFLSGRSIPAWVTGLAFISAHLAAQAVIGMGASGAKYGIAMSFVCRSGALLAMVFVGLFLVTSWHGCRATPAQRPSSCLREEGSALGESPRVRRAAATQALSRSCDLTRALSPVFASAKGRAL